MFFRTFKVFLVMMFIVALLIKPQVNAGSSQPSEYQIKAAFLYNFANFIDWPDGSFSDKTSPIILGVLGKDPFGRILNPAEGKVIKNRKLTIKRFESLEDFEVCHILFISSSEKENLKRILAKLNSFGVLTVGDTGGFTQRGGVINFFKKDNKVRLEINLDAAKDGDLKISSKLLNVAKITKSSKTEDDN